MDVRKYLGHLIVERKLEPSTVNIHSAAIRFFFAVTMNRTMNYLQIPRMKEPKKLPVILARDEVAELISQASNAKHRTKPLRGGPKTELPDKPQLSPCQNSTSINLKAVPL